MYRLAKFGVSKLKLVLWRITNGLTLTAKTLRRNGITKKPLIKPLASHKQITEPVHRILSYYVRAQKHADTYIERDTHIHSHAHPPTHKFPE